MNRLEAIRAVQATRGAIQLEQPSYEPDPAAPSYGAFELNNPLTPRDLENALRLQGAPTMSQLRLMPGQETAALYEAVGAEMQRDFVTNEYPAILEQYKMMLNTCSPCSMCRLPA